MKPYTTEYGTIRCGKLEIKHNGVPWTVKTNCHTTTNGYLWGWIEGPDENVYWSNERFFNEELADAVVNEHNQWLERQTEPTLRILDRLKNIELKLSKMEKIEEQFKRLRDEVNAEVKAITSILTEAYRGGDDAGKTKS